MSLDQLASNSDAWKRDDRPVPSHVPAWLQPLLIEMAAAKAEAAINLDRALETARKGGRP